jgi:hypothetical protein
MPIFFTLALKMSTNRVYVSPSAQDNSAQLNNPNQPFTLSGALQAIASPAGVTGATGATGSNSWTIYLSDGTYTLNQPLLLPPNTSLIGTDSSRVQLQVPSLNIPSGMNRIRNLSWTWNQPVSNPINLGPDANLDLQNMNISITAQKFSPNGRKIRLIRVNLNITTNGRRTAVINVSNSNAALIQYSQIQVNLTAPLVEPVSILGNYGPGEASIENSTVQVNTIQGPSQTPASVPVIVFDGFTNVSDVTIQWNGSGSESLVLVGGGTDTTGKKDIQVSNVQLQPNNINQVYRYYNTSQNTITLQNVTWGVNYTPAPYSTHNLPGGPTGVSGAAGVTGPLVIPRVPPGAGGAQQPVGPTGARPFQLPFNFPFFHRGATGAALTNQPLGPPVQQPVLPPPILPVGSTGPVIPPLIPPTGPVQGPLVGPQGPLGAPLITPGATGIVGVTAANYQLTYDGFGYPIIYTDLPYWYNAYPYYYYTYPYYYYNGSYSPNYYRYPYYYSNGNYSPNYYRGGYYGGRGYYGGGRGFDGGRGFNGGGGRVEGGGGGRVGGGGFGGGGRGGGGGGGRVGGGGGGGRAGGGGGGGRGGGGGGGRGR